MDALHHFPNMFSNIFSLNFYKTNLHQKKIFIERILKHLKGNKSYITIFFLLTANHSTILFIPRHCFQQKINNFCSPLTAEAHFVHFSLKRKKEKKFCRYIFNHFVLVGDEYSCEKLIIILFLFYQSYKN